MRFATIVLAGILGVSLLAGAAAASSARAEMRFDSPGQITGLIDATLDGEPAAQGRYFIDQFGNRDGTVSENEVESAERTFLDYAQAASDNEEPDSSQAGGDFTVDGKGPSKFELKVFDIKRAEGPVSSTSPVDVHLEMRIMFPVDGAERHDVHFQTSGMDEDEGDGEGPWDFELDSARIRAPGGYVIESVTGLPSGASVSSDKKTIDFGSAYQQAASVDIVFAKGGGTGFAPSAGLGVGLLLVAGAVLVRRRME